MRSRFPLVTILLVTLAGCAYHSPTAPTPPAVSDATPASVTLGVPSSNTVSAYVQNVHGAPLQGITVRFTSDAGALSPASAVTNADGHAASTLSASTDVHVTATVGTLSARATVLAPVIPPTPTPPTPPVGPTPTPPPPSPSVFLNVSASATTGVPLNFNVSSAATGVVWQWSFGDGATAQTTAFNTSHTYTSAGVYAASVAGAGTPTANATITVTDPVAPTPTTPAPSLTVTVGCLAATHATATFCNVSATDQTGAVVTSQLTNVTWDWGDGTPAAAQGVTTSHTYAQGGVYVIGVRASTAAGVTGTAAKSITVS